MPIFSKEGKSILFVHVPKAGGSSIEAFFELNGFKIAYLDTGGGDSLNHLTRCSPQHMHADMLKANLNLNAFDYIFMVVRHPFSRLKSEYLMHEENRRVSFRAWVYRIFDSYRVDSYVADNHIRPQSQFYLPGANVFKIEDGLGPEWVRRIQQKVGFEFEIPVPHDLNRKAIDGMSVKDIFVEADLAKDIYKFYETDFVEFGYG